MHNFLPLRCCPIRMGTCFNETRMLHLSFFVPHTNEGPSIHRTFTVQPIYLLHSPLRKCYAKMEFLHPNQLSNIHSGECTVLQRQCLIAIEKINFHLSKTSVLLNSILHLLLDICVCIYRLI